MAAGTIGTPPVLGLRADGGEGIGAGHLARCLALAQAWRDLGGAVVLASHQLPATWRARYETEGVTIIATGPGPEPEPEPGVAEIWVVDGYHLRWPASGPAHARIDDRAITPDDAVLVIDQNLGARAGDYPQPASQVLAGPRYALLRREVTAAAADHRPAHRHQQPLRLLVAQGGAPAEPVRRFVRALVDDLADEHLEITVWSGTDDPLPALRTSQLAVAPAGSTLWELCRFGIPAVVVTVAANQVPLAEAVVDAGLARSAGSVLGQASDADPGAAAALVRGLAGDPAEREAMAARQRQVVDGRGARRVATRLWGQWLRTRIEPGPGSGWAVDVADGDGRALARVVMADDGAVVVEPASADQAGGLLAAALEAATRAVALGSDEPGVVRLRTDDPVLASALLDADADADADAEIDGDGDGATGWFRRCVPQASP